jgi:hypothetical protein
VSTSASVAPEPEPVPACTLAVRPNPSRVVVVKWLPVFGEAFEVVAVMVHPVEA